MTANITGRDRAIIAQALYYAIKYIDGLPEWLREYSNQSDMAKLLKAIDPDFVKHETQINDLIREKMRKEPGTPIDMSVARHRTIPEVLTQVDD